MKKDLLLENILSTYLKDLELSTKNSGTFCGEWIYHDKNPSIFCKSPINGELLAEIYLTTESEYEKTIKQAENCFINWRTIPAPARGEIIRQIANEFRKHKHEIATLITLETGKILSEAEGEVQELVDIADYAVGLSRQLYGLTMHSERIQHRMYEQWHPLGVIGVITAFNFPLAVWGWNAMIAAVCGNTVVWKPSEITPLTAIAATKICNQVTSRHGFSGLFSLVNGEGSDIGKKMAADKRLPLISATGSCSMGRSVAEAVAKRLGRSLLELGGNNAVIVHRDANLELAERAVLFGALGTCGQRCTTIRRLFLHEEIYDAFIKRIISAYSQIKIGNPLESGVLIGPLSSSNGVNAYIKALSRIRVEGGKIICGGKGILPNMPSNLYVEPTIVEANHEMPIVYEETFAPLLYVFKYHDLTTAIKLQNSVSQGLSSAIFTDNISSAELFLSAEGSDCGIANVNIGTSGAEIGGAFGGEKDTGGGREAGSDSWKNYMRRQTTTINWGKNLPLAQGITFS